MPARQIYIFDKGFSARAAVLAMGGAHHALGLGADAGETLAFQPLRQIDRGGRAQLGRRNGSRALLAHEKVLVTPEVKEALWSALASLAIGAAEERTLTGLSLLLQSNPLRTALWRLYARRSLWAAAGRGRADDLALADVQCFETEALMGQAGVVAPVLTYLFHRLEDAVRRSTDPADPRRGLDLPRPSAVRRPHPRMARRCCARRTSRCCSPRRAWPTSPASAIAPAIIESCPQRILLPNDRAIEPQSPRGLCSASG